MKRVGLGAMMAAVVMLCWSVMGAQRAQAASIAEATELISAGKSAQAVEMLQAIVAAAPDNLPAHFWLGRAGSRWVTLRGQP